MNCVSDTGDTPSVGDLIRFLMAEANTITERLPKKMGVVRMAFLWLNLKMRHEYPGRGSVAGPLTSRRGGR